MSEPGISNAAGRPTAGEPARGQQVVIRWWHSMFSSKWTAREELPQDAASLLATTIGYAVWESSDVLCIASSINESTGMVGNLLFVPKATIVDRYTIHSLQEKSDELEKRT
ncbi:hypothetical protein LCGC14_1012400 [marine sediment metagenome]|uniref:Uncharacterized protein n=1 Tax=marine sediment metagenome TaxID=412755 RepID=A0A0F9N4C7_9ZZZZ